jgi:homoprotocatechuate degradation regulator HpaR
MFDLAARHFFSSSVLLRTLIDFTTHVKYFLFRCIRKENPLDDHMVSDDLSRTDRSLPIALLRARETVMGPIREMLAQSGINEQKWRVLRVLDEGGPMEHSAIADAACLTLSSLTRMLRAMEVEGLVSRVEDEVDRRRTIVTIAEPGRSIIAAHAPESRAIADRIEAEFGRDRLIALLDLLEDLRKLPV